MQYLERRKELKNLIILSYGIYFLFFAIADIFILINAFFIISIMIRGFGGFIFSLVIESNIQKIWKTRYVVSILFIGSMIISPFLLNTSFFTSGLIGFNILFLSCPLFFTFYFALNVLGETKRNLIIALFGILLIFGGLAVTSYGIFQILEPLPSYPYILFFSRILTIFGIVLVIGGFHGYPFFLEYQWKENLITLLIIDKSRTTELYHKEFQELQLNTLGILAGGIAGIVNIIKEFTESQKNIDVINIEDKLIFLDYGTQIITALLVKKNLQHAKYILKQITSKFETFFLDYLKSAASRGISIGPEEISKSMEIILRDTIKLER